MSAAPTNITSTAPKRIYLDIGDQFAMESVTAGSLRWDLLEGVTWSEDNATSHGIPYVRADLATHPAASGAAPALPEALRKLRSYVDETIENDSEYRCDFREDLQNIRDYVKDVVAALASREASHPTLTETPQELERALGQAIDERDERDEVIDALCDAVLGKDRTEWSSMYGFRDAVNEVEEHITALASPQVAPALSPTAGMNMAQRILHVGGRDNAAGYVEFGSIQAVEALVRQVLRDRALAAPVQVAPHPDDLCQACKGAGGTQTSGTCAECYGQGSYGGARTALAFPQMALKGPIEQFRALLRAEVDASIDVSGDVVRQEASIDEADHLLCKFNELFPEVSHVRA